MVIYYLLSVNLNFFCFFFLLLYFYVVVCGNYLIWNDFNDIWRKVVLGLINIQRKVYDFGFCMYMVFRFIYIFCFVGKCYGCIEVNDGWNYGLIYKGKD